MLFAATFKKYVSFLSLITFLSCQTSITVMTKDAIVRASPNNNSTQLYKNNEIVRISFEGVSSNKEKMVINGKEHDEYWYLIKEYFNNTKRNETKDRRQGWVYGGYIELTEDVIKPSFSPISDKDLEKKQVDFTLCGESYHNGGENFTHYECAKGEGTIRFYTNNKFIRFLTKDIGMEYWTGTYKVKENVLILTFETKYVFISDYGELEMKTALIKPIKQYGIHNIWQRPVFIYLPEYEEEYMTWTRSFFEEQNDIFARAQKELKVNYN